MLRDQYHELVARHGSRSFDADTATPGSVIDNDWELIEQRLAARRPASPSRKRAVPSVRVDSADHPTLARRVRELEALDATRRKELADMQRIAQRGAFAWTIDPESAYAQLEQMRQTKLYRWTRPLRRVYSKVRFRRDVM